jgi:hypothetical protein
MALNFQITWKFCARHRKFKFFENQIRRKVSLGSNNQIDLKSNTEFVKIDNTHRYSTIPKRQKLNGVTSIGGGASPIKDSAAQQTQ